MTATTKELIDTLTQDQYGFLGGLLEGASYLFPSEPEVGSSTEGSCGGLLFSGSLGGSLSVKGRVPTESWE